MSSERVAILGCGYVGLELASQLRPSYRVFGIRRSPAGLEAVMEVGADPIDVDLTDPDALADLPAADAIVFAASPGRGTEPREIYIEALSAVIEEYGNRESPPDRLLYTSSSGVYGDHDGGWVDESTPIFPDTERQEVLVEAESLTLETAPEHGIDGTVVRFGGLYGPDRYRLDRYLEGPVTAGYLNLVHRQDAAGVLRFLLETDQARNDTVLAVDTEPVDKWTFADWLAGECGEPLPAKQTVEERLADASLPNSAEQRILANKRCSSEKLQELGYEFAFPTARDGYQPAIEAYRSASSEA